jgi:hypothetical protein
VQAESKAVIVFFCEAQCIHFLVNALSFGPGETGQAESKTVKALSSRFGMEFIFPIFKFIYERL